jgi:hypothetical protein
MSTSVSWAFFFFFFNFFFFHLCVCVGLLLKSHRVNFSGLMLVLELESCSL